MLGTPLYVLLVGNVILQSMQPCLVEGRGAPLSHADGKAGLLLALGGTCPLHQWRQFYEKRLIHQTVLGRTRFPVN